MENHPLIHFHEKGNVIYIGARLKECCPMCEEEEKERLNALLRTGTFRQ